ncbi:MAG: DASS family sodium-coupled anion symporter [Neisseriaceae bacterium]|nr:DASS family sodium-coupled anion symporter [Neisseriaceae bacterium]MBP6861484.1 DASS family sodium-coupled anion symporter [Neisseriaceae bacterium]
MDQQPHPTDMSDKDQRKTIKGLAICVVALIAAFAVYSLLPFDDAANKGLALLVLIAILWLTEAIHVTITALLIPVMAIAIGLPEMNTKTAVAAFADPIIFLFFGGFALASALHVQKLDKKIAFWLISLSGSHLGVTAIAIFGVTALLSMWISNTATAAMMLPLAMGVMSHMDAKSERPTFLFILLGIAYSASIGGLGTLVGSPPNAIAAKALGLDFVGWMKLGLPLMLVLLPLMVFSLYLVFKPKLNRKIEVNTEVIPWTPSRIIAMTIFILTAAAWIGGTWIQKTFDISSPDTFIALCAAVLVVMFGVTTWRQVSDNTDWGVLFLFGGGLTLSAILRSSGASAVLGDQVAAIFGSANPFIIILAVTTFIIILTEFTSNTASAALLVPVFAGIAEQMGMPASVLVMMIGIGASCAFMLPVATPPNAIVFGTGVIKQRDMIVAGGVLNVMCIIVLSLWGYFFLM